MVVWWKMYELYIKENGKEIFVGFFKSVLEIENLKRDYPNKEFVIYKVISDFGDLNE
jgi:hypothetical protein